MTTEYAPKPVPYPWPLGLDAITHRRVSDYPAADVIPAHPANYSRRGSPVVPITAVVLHATVGSQAATVAWFRNPKSGVSAHYVIGRRGRVIQMVPESMRAHHAGKSEYDGLTDWNRYSIGIELVNRNDGEPFWLPQITALIDLLKHLRQTYPIHRERIVTHATISKHLTGKTDPKGLPLRSILEIVYKEDTHDPAQ